MKQLTLLFVLALSVISCTTTIPLQSNLSDQTLLLAENKNIKAMYVIKSNIPDGFLVMTSVMKNGTVTNYNESYKYASSSAFKNIWQSYFKNKFNDFSSDVMNVEVVLKDIRLKQNAATSVGLTLLTGNAKMTNEAHAEIYVKIDYKGKVYEKSFEVSESEYNESQMMKSGNYTYTVNQTNPTMQLSKLLEACLNRSIVQFENYIRTIIMASNEKKLL